MHVNTAELDLLLLLDDDRTRCWSVGNAASALRLPRAVVRRAAEALAARNLLEVRFGEDVLYRLDPGSPDLKELVQRIVDAGRVSSGMADVDARTKGPDDVDGNGSHA
jgi:hypothetical protein